MSSEVEIVALASTLQDILAEEVLKVSPEDTAMAATIRSGEPPNNYAKIALDAMRRAYVLGVSDCRASHPDQL